MANNSVATTLGQIPDDEAWHRTIILPRDILDNPPSGEHEHGEVTWDVESSHRSWGCELLQEAGILLRCVLSISIGPLLQLFHKSLFVSRFLCVCPRNI